MDAERPFVTKRVQTHGPEWDVASKAIRRAIRLTAELNKLSFDDAAKVREIFSELTGRKVDDTFVLIPPFYSMAWRTGHIDPKLDVFFRLYRSQQIITRLQ